MDSSKNPITIPNIPMIIVNQNWALLCFLITLAVIIVPIESKIIQKANTKGKAISPPVRLNKKKIPMMISITPTITTNIDE